MAEAKLPETRTPDQLPRATAVSPEALVTVQEEGGPVQSLPIDLLFRRVTATDAIREVEAEPEGLQGALDFDEHSIGLVTADPDPAKCGWYYKVGASGAGNWVQFEKLSSKAAAEVQLLVDEAQGWAEDAEAASADVPLLRRQISYVDRVMGPADVVAAAGSGAAGTYTFGRAFGRSGVGLALTYYGMGTGTAYFQISTRAGSTVAIVEEREFAVSPGLQTVDFPDLAFTSVQFAGYRALGGLIGVDAGSSADFDGYWSTAAQVAEGASYDDATLGATAAFRLAVDQISLLPLAQTVATVADQGALIGGPLSAGAVIARPADAVLAAGNAVAGGSIYAFETIAANDLILSRLRVYATAAGTAVVSALAGTVAASAEVATVEVPLALGLNDIEDVGLVLHAGERLAIRRGGAGIALTTAVGDVTPFRTFAAGALSALNSTIRFEVSAEFEPWGLVERVGALEGDGGGSTALAHPTKALHIVLMLGESHVAGRALIYASAIPAGRGWCYRRATTSIAHLVDPTNNEAIDRGSWGPSIGQTMLDMTGGAVGALIINSGDGGTTVADWAAAGGSWVQAKADWDNAIAAIKAAKIPIAGVTIAIGIGSNDAAAGTAKATFKAGLLDLINRAKAYVGAGGDVPVALVQTGPFADGSSAAAVLACQQAQAEIVREEDSVYMATSAPKFAAEYGWFMDNVHFAQPGNDAIGPAIAAVALARGAGLYPAGLE